MKVFTTLKKIGLGICMAIFFYALISVFQLAHGVFQASTLHEQEEVSEVAEVESARFEPSDIVESLIPGMKKND